MNTATLKALQNWLHGRGYTLEQVDAQLILKYHGQKRAVITPPDHSVVKDVDLNVSD